MKDLTISQEYLLCRLNEKGKLPLSGSDGNVCVVAGAILDLLLEGCIEIDKKKVTVKAGFPAGKEHLRPLYDSLAAEKPLSLEKIVEKYNYSFTAKKFNELFYSIGDSLEKEGLVEATPGGLNGHKKNYIPNREAVTRIIDKLRAELLEEGEISDDTVALAALLSKSGALKTYFSKFEQKEVSDKLKAISASPSGALVKQMVDYLDQLIAAMTVVTLSAMPK